MARKGFRHSHQALAGPLFLRAIDPADWLPWRDDEPKSPFQVDFDADLTAELDPGLWDEEAGENQNRR